MNARSIDAGWREHAAALAGQLADAGVLTDPRWRAAIEQTPRHVFVPRFYRNDHTITDGADPTTAEQWPDDVYHDDSLVVRRATAPGADQEWPTSSSTMPSLMIRMLELLEVTDASQVLEIGTATGYNARRTMIRHRNCRERPVAVRYGARCTGNRVGDSSARLACANGVV